METSACHFHVDDALLRAELKLVGGDDAVRARWLDVADNADFNALYASHRSMVVKAVELATVRASEQADATDDEVRRWLAALDGVQPPPGAA